MKITRIGDVQNSLIRLILWQVGKEPITDRHLRAAKDHFNNECAYCGEKKDLDFDHAVPINKTSLGQQRVGNLVPSCTDCNQKKGQRHFNDYLSSDPDGGGLSRCPRLADMWYGGLAHPAEGTGATGACNGEGANSDGIPGWFPGRGELRGIPV